jgi:hypothetical protein
MHSIITTTTALSVRDVLSTTDIMTCIAG